MVWWEYDESGLIGCNREWFDTGLVNHMLSFKYYTMFSTTTECRPDHCTITGY